MRCPHGGVAPTSPSLCTAGGRAPSCQVLAAPIRRLLQGTCRSTVGRARDPGFGALSGVCAYGKRINKGRGTIHSRGTSMHIHEYQAKRLERIRGTRGGTACRHAREAEQAARDSPGPVWVVSADPYRGRGKVGGVKVCRSPEEAREAAASSSAHGW